MFDIDKIIDDIVDPVNDQGKLPSYSEVADPPPFVMPQHEEDEYGSVGDCYVIEGDEFTKMRIKDLRRKKCEWVMGQQLLQLIQARCHERVFEDDNGEEWCDLKIILYNPETRNYETFDDDFEKHIGEVYGLNKESATKMAETLLNNTTGDWIGIFLVR